MQNKNKELDRLNGVYMKLLNNAGVKYIEGRGTLVDAHTVEVGGKQYTVSILALFFALGYCRGVLAVSVLPDCVMPLLMQLLLCSDAHHNLLCADSGKPGHTVMVSILPLHFCMHL